MWIAEFSNYKIFLKARIKTYPGKGRGQASRLAEFLNISRLAVSQILNHDRQLTIDQALEVSRFFGFDEMSTEYFVLMVSQARAEKKEAKSFFDKKMARLREEAEKIKSNVEAKQILSEGDMGIFYSNWQYVGIACLVSVNGFQTVDSIAQYFGLSRTKVAEIVSFLVSSGILREQGGKILTGPASTFVSEPSPFLHNHRRNWRLKAIESSIVASPNDVIVSIPVSISNKDADIVRKDLVQLINRFSKLVTASKEEKVMCLNIDWFNF